MGRPKAVLAITDEEREALERYDRGRRVSQALALRARIVLGAASDALYKYVEHFDNAERRHSTIGHVSPNEHKRLARRPPRHNHHKPLSAKSGHFRPILLIFVNKKSLDRAGACDYDYDHGRSGARA